MSNLRRVFAAILVVALSTIAIPAQSLVTSWSFTGVLAPPDGVNGANVGPNGTSVKNEAQALYLDNGKVVLAWIAASTGFADREPSVNNVFTSVFTPSQRNDGGTWSEPTLIYSAANTSNYYRSFRSLRVTRTGPNSAAWAFTQVNNSYDGVTVSSEAKVFSVVSSSSGTGTDTWRSVQTIPTGMLLNNVVDVGGFEGVMTVALSSAATLSSSWTSIAYQYVSSTQVLTEFPLPALPVGTQLHSYSQGSTGTHVWLYTNVNGEYSVMTAPIVQGVTSFNSLLSLAVNGSAVVAHFARAPEMENPISGVLIVSDSASHSWSFVISAGGSVLPPVRLASVDDISAVALDSLGYAYIAGTKNDGIETFRLLAALKLDNGSTTLIHSYLPLDTTIDLAVNTTGRLLILERSLTEMKLYNAISGRIYGNETTISESIDDSYSFSFAGGKSNFMLFTYSLNGGLRFHYQYAEAPEPVVAIQGAWIASNVGMFSWQPPNLDSDLVYSWEADCGRYGVRQGESDETSISLPDVGANVRCSIDVVTLQGSLASNPMHAELPALKVSKPNRVRSSWASPTSAKISWSASPTAGATYSIKVSTTSFIKTVSSSTTTAIVKGLNLKSTYRVEVKAIKFGVESQLVVGGITPAKKASAPRAVKITGTGAAIALKWTAPATNASAVYGYQVSVKVGSGKYKKLGEVATTTFSLNRKFSAKAKLTFKVEALTGYTSPAALSPVKTTKANGYL